MSVRISIITITFNSEKTLEQTIKSIVGQGYENLEYIIIDGGSKDGTLDIINKYRDNISFIINGYYNNTLGSNEELIIFCEILL